jgi:hypothetical protein
MLTPYLSRDQGKSCEDGLNWANSRLAADYLGRHCQGNQVERVFVGFWRSGGRKKFSKIRPTLFRKQPAE